MKQDYIVIALFCIVMIICFLACIGYSEYKKRKKPKITQLQVVEQEVEVDERFFLIAIYSNGEKVIMNKDKPLNLENMEKYFEKEMEKLCTK